ncbi:hypothetical protein JMUB6875_70360 [Nocardia sp. JMUB6875]|uniref:ubiquitin family protein n=1 Tax=Nocardia sp. JMUB6875 TaxID=3158170 RepID=UPI0032E5A5BA
MRRICLALIAAIAVSTAIGGGAAAVPGTTVIDSPPRIAQGYVVYVKTINGTQYTIDSAEPSTTIEEFKEILGEKMNTAPDRLRLIFAGKELMEGRTLSDYNIQSGSTLHVVLR